MRNLRIDDLDQVPRPVIAIGNDYPAGYLLPMHSHRRAQLLYGATGVMHVFTRQGNWLVPPQRAVWLPPQMPHEVRMVGVTTRSLYIEPTALAAAQPQVCQVVSVTPLLRQLLMAAVDMPLEYQQQGRDGALVSLLLHEIAHLQSLPLHIPLPADRRLEELCQGFLQQPDAHDSPQAWAKRLYMSIRSFSRFFRDQTGMSFSQWRQRACVVLALARLAEGNSVTQVALEMGYESSAAFATMFRRVLGQAPSCYLSAERREIT
ncbi:AraC family transcriptional regulator [Serratia quinivorans]|jgi:AraC-like DNA-binding protein|uniref:AraC family transcriptional regulator n=1 Tax=Serratia quinivorans TaxID=137545 RepID=UPI00217B9478|nr:helix-turn-helix transcriptional regulator [Serratia quinivorans]CAI1031459.1 HTH-type transcriptional repressor of iron proteins A [Serratia quinivorans]CAI2113705.1 HTH-type transcriptional repressor of iron proteins A [Serratia quinivorans]CAI2132272.1 HTH-type transcriptional repressor of iron proteins A [Serratia quinivorans]